MKKLDIIENILDQRQAEDIKVIDLNNQSSVADYFVIASATGINHAKSLAEKIEEELEKENETVLSTEGLRDGNWILIDCADVIVHLFTKSTREYYDLEELWDK